MNHQVEVLVPVHSDTRPLHRLVASVLDANAVPARVTVIAHNIESHRIVAALGEWGTDERVRVLPFVDGIHSPAGPLGFGLQNIEAPFFTKIDSDDFLSDGALDAWFETQRRTGADIVIPAMRLVGGNSNYPTPPARLFRRQRLDPVRDRLAYRTSNMGLFRAALALKAAPTSGLPTGEDIIPGLRLWFSGSVISAAPASYPYLVGEDAIDRVTAEPFPLAAELGFIAHLTCESELTELPENARLSYVAKLLRVQVFGAVARRPHDWWTAEERNTLAAVAAPLVALAPRIRTVLSRTDVQLLDEVLAGSTGTEALSVLAQRRNRYSAVASLVTRNLFDSMRRDAPLRFLVASWVASKGL